MNGNIVVIIIRVDEGKGEIIKDIKYKSELNRFLGVHWTLDGNPQQTVEMAFKALEMSLQQLRRKHT